MSACQLRTLWNNRFDESLRPNMFRMRQEYIYIYDKDEHQTSKRTRGDIDDSLNPAMPKIRGVEGAMGDRPEVFQPEPRDLREKEALVQNLIQSMDETLLYNDDVSSAVQADTVSG